jgi:hypothetical protein
VDRSVRIAQQRERVGEVIMKSRRDKQGEGLPADLKQRLNAAREGLLRVHKALLDHERTRYEREHGKFAGNVEALQAVINNPFFAWLRPVSELIVGIDETEAADEAASAAQARALLAQAIDLLKADEMGEGFQREYYRAMQGSPDVIAAHAEWKSGVGKKPG